MVAPSFVMVMSPTLSTSILSNPTGPRDDLRMFETVWHAVTSLVSCVHIPKENIQLRLTIGISHLSSARSLSTKEQSLEISAYALLPHFHPTSQLVTI